MLLYLTELVEMQETQRGYILFESTFASTLLDEEEPECFEDTRDNMNRQHAMKEELSSIEKNKTGSLVDLPPGKKAIDTQ